MQHRHILPIAWILFFGNPNVAVGFVSKSKSIHPFYGASTRRLSSEISRLDFPPKYSPATRCYGATNENNGHETNNYKDILNKNYEISQYTCSAIAILLLIIPDRTLTTLLATKVGGAAGFAMAARLSTILRKANREDRLNSNTYKRLNLGMLGFAVAGLVAIPGEAGFFPRAIPSMITWALLTGVRGHLLYTSFQGWMTGIDKRELTLTGTTSRRTETIRRLWEEVRGGTDDTLGGLLVKDSKRALTYRNCLLVSMFGTLSAILEGFFNMRVRGMFTGH